MPANSLFVRSLAGILLSLVIVFFTGCGLLGDRRDAAYQGAGSGRALEVPPDLLPPERDATYRVPPREDGRVSAVEAEERQRQPSGILGAAPAPDAGRVAPREVDDMAVRREGSVRWLELRAEPDGLWQGLRAFWREQGFELSRDEPAVGIMETEWRQEGAGVPEEGYRGALRRVLGTLYDAQYQDRYRIRLEREADGVTNLYLSHRGVEQTVEDPQAGGIRWVMRPSDPDLEAEMLTRLMVFLGSDGTEAGAMLDQTADAGPSLRERELDGEPGLELRGTFSQVWRQVGLGLDRAGLLVDDQDRQAGVFHVTYNPAATESRPRGGFLGRLFRREPVSEGARYQIRLSQQEPWVRVTVLDREGGRLSAGDARTVLGLLRDEIR